MVQQATLGVAMVQVAIPGAHAALAWGWREKETGEDIQTNTRFFLVQM